MKCSLARPVHQEEEGVSQPRSSTKGEPHEKVLERRDWRRRVSRRSLVVVGGRLAAEMRRWRVCIVTAAATGKEKIESKREREREREKEKER